MAWNPEKYNVFKTERFAPFDDLMQLIEVRPNLEVIDLGCGTGELTKKLENKLPDAHILGIDASPEMLKDAAQWQTDRLTFEHQTMEKQLSSGKKWDVIVANASIQWSEDHHLLLPKIIGALKPGGQIAIQVPSQHDNQLNRILLELVQEEPYSTALQQWKRISPVLKIDEYAQILFENGSWEMTVYEKVYPLIVQEPDALFEFINGTALIPYLERMDKKIQADFIQTYKTRIAQKFNTSPILYPFKRIFIAGKF